jgi:hypothetical protein
VDFKKARVNLIAIVVTLKGIRFVCTAVLSYEICFGDHVKKVYPNLKSLQSTAIPCGYAVEGLGFDFIPIAENPKIPSDDKSTVVRVLKVHLLQIN